MSNRLQFIILILVVIVLSTTIQISVDPHYEGMSTDSGVFAYCGNEILNGKLLYRDCLDNKPPAIYYLNAAAILIGGATPFAIWVFHSIWITITFLAFLWLQNLLWKNSFSNLISIIFVLTVLYPAYYIGGNFTETYALLTIICSIAFLYLYLLRGQRRYLLALGLSTAFAFLLKPTYIGIGLSSSLVIFFLNIRQKSLKNSFGSFLIIISSFLIPLILVALIWIYQNDLYDLIFAVFLHNRGYIEESISFHSVVSTIKLYLVYQPLASLSAFAGITIAGFFYTNRAFFKNSNKVNYRNEKYIPGKMGILNTRIWLVTALGLSAFIDFFLIAISAKNFGHYFLISIPVIATLCAYYFIQISILRKQHLHPFSLATIVIIPFVLLLPLIIETASKEVPNPVFLRSFFTDNISIHRPNELERYILDNRSPEQSVLIWGLRPDLNFSTHRRSPSRFIFLLHLFTPTSKGENGFAEFLQSISNDPPAVIVVDITSGTLPYFGAEGDNRCPGCTTEAKVGMEKLNQFVENNYLPDGQIYDWLAFRHR